MNTKEENLSYNEEITSRGNEELEKLQKVEDDDAQNFDEYIIHLNNELRGTIVNKKLKKIENQKNNKIVEDYVLKLLIEHNYRLLENDGGKKHQPILSW